MRLRPDAPSPPPPSEQLAGEATAADVFAAVHQPALKIAEGAPHPVKNSITASIAIDPDLSGAGKTEIQGLPRPAGRIPGLANTVGQAQTSSAVNGGEEPQTVLEGVEAALEDGDAVLELPGGAPKMGTLADAWKAMQGVFPDAFLLEGSPVAFINAPSCTQVWIHCNQKLKQVRFLQAHAWCACIMDMCAMHDLRVIPAVRLSGMAAQGAPSYPTIVPW